jgi:hypothetical protein
MNESEREREHLAEAIVTAWRDDAHRAQLVADPVRVLRDAGLPLPSDCTVTVLENPDRVSYVAVPRPEELTAGELDEDELQLAQEGNGGNGGY